MKPTRSTDASKEAEALRQRSAREMARMFAKGRKSKYGSPVVDGLGLMDNECSTVALALREYAKKRGEKR